MNKTVLEAHLRGVEERLKEIINSDGISEMNLLLKELLADIMRVNKEIERDKMEMIR
jgi:hypothetical protein